MNLPASPQDRATDHPSRVLTPPSRVGMFANSLLIIAGLWAAIYIAGMFSPALLDDADSVHAEAAREMVVRHDWITLHVNGLRYLEKAPLLYWGIAGSFAAFGVSEWSARLPLMLGILAMLLATYALGRRAYGEHGGLLSAVALGTALGPYLFTRFLIPDTLVGLWLTLSLYFFYRSLEEDPPSRFTAWGLAISCALNVLTKGLIGLVFPAGIIGLYLILTGNLRHLLRLRLVSSTIVFLIVAAPWHILASLQNPDQGNVRGFLWFYFVNEQFLRYLNQRVPRDYDTVPLLLFWALMLLWMIPWVAFLPQTLRGVPHRWRQLRSGLDQAGRANLLFLLWALVILVFFSFSTRQEYYTIPALPGLALLIGGWLGREMRSDAHSSERRAGGISSGVLLGTGVAIFAVVLALFFVSSVPPPGTDLADLLKKNPEDYALSFGHFLDLTPRALGAFHRPLLGFGLAFLLGTGANWWFRKRGQPSRGNAALALMMVGLLTCVHFAFITFSPILSSKNLAVAVEQHYRPGDLVVIDGEYEAGSTLNFYARVPLRILHERTGNLYYGSQFPDAPHVFETQESFDALWNGPARVFMWTDQEDPKELHGAPRYPLAHSGGKSILMNHPLSE